MSYELDNIYLADCYKAIKEIPDKSIDLIVTDPPYEICTGGAGIMKDRNKGGNFMVQIRDKSLDVGINLSILDDFVRVMKKINIYIWCNKEQIYDYMTYFVKEHGCNFEFLIWVKDAPMPFCGAHYLKDKEYCLYFWEQGANIHIPYEKAKTVFYTQKNTADKKLYGHPTIKPLEIIKTLIENSCPVAGGVILDPFSGSGTTAHAAKQLGRHFIAFEIDEEYYKKSIDRLNGISVEQRQAIEEGQMTLF